MGRCRTSQERESRSHQAPGAQPLAPAGRNAMHRRFAEGPIPTSLSWPPTNRPARVTQPSDESVVALDAERTSSGLRFARFAAAMQVNRTPQDQLLEGLSRSQRRADPMAASSIRPLRRVRMLTADPVKSLRGIEWLGIGSWAFFCVALFVSLLASPARHAVDRGTSLQANHTLQRAIVSDIPPTADPAPPAPALGPGE
jgi:hypothetical protein